MARIEPCDWCDKGHYSEKARYRCMLQNSKPECTCPEYARKRDWAHSKRYNCPLAKEGV